MRDRELLKLTFSSFRVFFVLLLGSSAAAAAAAAAIICVYSNFCA